VLLQLLVQYWLNFWNRNFFDALAAKDGPTLWALARLFVLLLASSIALGLLSVWGRMTAQRKWRESVTRSLIEHWLKNNRYQRLKHIAGGHQQADARIAQDARVATDAPIDLGLGLLNSVLGAIVFVDVLWTVGGDLSINVSNGVVTIPGYLVVAVILYSALITIAMMIIGRHLTHVIQDLDQAEATFRSAASCLCEVANHVAPSDSEEATMRNALLRGLEQVLARWRDFLWQLL
jgi:putative ATP-binding cassette transporter